MIGWGDVYKVVEAMAPLYMALFLGYASIRWWNMFKPENCAAINRFNCYFIIPFFNFRFISQVNPYTMNYRFLASDAVAKSAVAAVLVAWANCARKGGFDWSLTTFSLSTLNNTLVVGVPLLQAMYGDLGFDIVVQSAVIQAALWLTFLLFGLEFRRTRLTETSSPDIGNGVDENVENSAGMGGDVELAAGGNADDAVITTRVVMNVRNKTSFGTLIKVVSLKLAKNPNSYAWLFGMVWALVSYRWHFKMPGIVDQSILILAKAGSGVAMFNMGLFMALQEKIISCGTGLTIYGLVLRFVIGPATSALGAMLLRLHGDVFKIAIVQAALPQSTTAFVYGNEYGLHADVISTAVIIGTIVSLPVLIGYYAALDLLH
ncbi:PREDICTED: auxin efflux carrier component 5-like [Ipomoea nil]|uniref:auxin efflux carrier component 5-like n=1 Tax=Ipomoea nil TaxID=35883 RepID=UPI000900DFD1|nr:PREDICTED: auxin efflux carrier component 5-like [Ipomoea nil]